MSQLMFKRAMLLLGLFTSTPAACVLTSNSKSDPFPVYKTLEPQEYLYTNYRDTMKGLKPFYVEERFGLFISPFGQNANIGKNIRNEAVPLGDLEGRWFMLGMLLGPTPQGKTLAPTLATARAALFPSIPPNTPIIDGTLADPQQNFGFFSIPLTYRKRGLRFEFETQLWCTDVGLQIQGGFSDICQTVTAYNDLTTDKLSTDCLGNFPQLTGCNVKTYLMQQRKQIATEIGLDMGNFHQFSFEDLRLNLYWRHAYLINEFRETWPTCLLIPFVSVGFNAATSKKPNVDFAFSQPFGNGGHNALGAEAGINIDFAETIEIGGLAGATYFFGKDINNYFVPTSECQYEIFPFRTDVHITPGFNWHFGLLMNARHFIGRLSFYFQYMIVGHEDDKITLKTPDPAFLPEVLEARSTWKTQVANMAFNYDISPNISLGFLWQAPLSQRNSYRSSTVMFGFNAIF